MSIITVLPSQPPIYASVGSLPSNAVDGAEAVVLTTPPSIYLFNGTSWNYAAGGSSGGLTGVGVNGELALWDSTTDLTAISYSAVSGTNNIVSRDTNGNSYVNNLIPGYHTTLTATTTTVLTVASAQLQYFTGSTTQTVTLPVANTLVLGQSFTVVNSSSGAVTVQSSGANTVQVVSGNTFATFTCILTSGTTASSWSVQYASASGSGTVTSVALTAPALLTVGGSPITTAGTLALSYSGTALPVANGGTNSVTALNSNRFMISSSSEIIEASAVTASKVVVSDTNGLPTAATTSTTQVNYLSAVTGTTGTTNTNIVFSGSPTLVTPLLGTPQSGTLTSCSGLPLTTGVTGILPIANGGTNVGSVTVVPAATAFAGWDANTNLTANNHIESYTTTVTSATPVVLTVGSTYQQYFTGSTAQTVTLPVANTLVLGQQFQVVNLSSNTTTVNSSGANAVRAMAAATTATYTCILASGTTAASWSVEYTLNSSIGTVSSVALTVPSLLSISGSPITTSGTLGLTFSGTALPVANGGTNSTTALSNGFILVSSGGAIIEGGQSVSASNSQAGASYSVVTGDYGKLIRLTDTVARAITLPTAPVDGFFVEISDTAGTSYTANITMTAGGSDKFTVNGTASFIIDSEFATYIFQYDHATATWEII